MKGSMKMTLGIVLAGLVWMLFGVAAQASGSRPSAWFREAYTGANDYDFFLQYPKQFQAMHPHQYERFLRKHPQWFAELHPHAYWEFLQQHPELFYALHPEEYQQWREVQWLEEEVEWLEEQIELEQIREEEDRQY